MNFVSFLIVIACASPAVAPVSAVSAGLSAPSGQALPPLTLPSPVPAPLPVCPAPGKGAAAFT